MKFAEVNEVKHAFSPWKCFMSMIPYFWLLVSRCRVPRWPCCCCSACFGSAVLSPFPEEDLLVHPPVSPTEQVAKASWAPSPAAFVPLPPRPSELPVWKSHHFSFDANLYKLLEFRLLRVIEKSGKY